MGRAPCCDKANVKRGPWSPEEDAKLKSYIENHGTGGNWIALPPKIGLKRCGKSCRLRWLNYLRPNLKHGGFTHEEDNLICTLYITIGSRWSIIAAQLPGRTDNDIKNYWNTRLKKKLMGRQRRQQRQTNKINEYNHQLISPPTLCSTNSMMMPAALEVEQAQLPWNNLQTTSSTGLNSTAHHFHYDPCSFISTTVQDQQQQQQQQQQLQQHLSANSVLMNCSTSTTTSLQQQLGGDFRSFDEIHERRSYHPILQEMDGIDNIFDNHVWQRKTPQNWTFFFDQPRILGYSE